MPLHAFHHSPWRPSSPVSITATSFSPTLSPYPNPYANPNPNPKLVGLIAPAPALALAPMAFPSPEGIGDASPPSRLPLPLGSPIPHFNASGDLWATQAEGMCLPRPAQAAKPHSHHLAPAPALAPTTLRCSALRKPSRTLDEFVEEVLASEWSRLSTPGEGIKIAKELGTEMGLWEPKPLYKSDVNLQVASCVLRFLSTIVQPSWSGDLAEFRREMLPKITHRLRAASRNNKRVQTMSASQREAIVNEELADLLRFANYMYLAQTMGVEREYDAMYLVSLAADGNRCTLGTRASLKTCLRDAIYLVIFNKDKPVRNPRNPDKKRKTNDEGSPRKKKLVCSPQFVGGVNVEMLEESFCRTSNEQEYDFEPVGIVEGDSEVDILDQLDLDAIEDPSDAISQLVSESSSCSEMQDARHCEPCWSLAPLDDFNEDPYLCSLDFSSWDILSDL